MSDASALLARAAGPFRVLIVEDEPLMRSIIVQLARSEGYEVMRRRPTEVA